MAAKTTICPICGKPSEYSSCKECGERKRIGCKLLQDGDGHWYLIPAAYIGEFYDWISAMENDLDWYGGIDDYATYRVDGPHRILIHDWVITQ